MKRVTVAIAGILLCGASAGSGRAENPPPMPLVIQADARYRTSHGWGHVFRCTVCRVLRGDLRQGQISLEVYGTVDLHGGALRPFTNPKCLILTFGKRGIKSMTMEGFRDDAGVQWEPRSVKNCDEEKMGPCRNRN